MSAEPVAAEIPVEIRQAVADLSSTEFSKREASEKQLIALGASAFEPLITSLGSVPPEAGQHIVQILEQIWVTAPMPQADTLERQLETLRLTQGPYQPAMTRILLAHHRIREQRAVKSLRRLNAIVESGLDEDEVQFLAQMGQPIPNELPTRISQIILPRSWKGTEADLWHIQRLFHLESLTVYVIENSSINEVARQRMHIGFPNLMIVPRAEVYIGVMPPQFDNGQGCRVGNIQSGSPAETAGLEVGDLIVSVDGLPIANFTALVDTLKTKRGYQHIELEVDREPDHELFEVRSRRRPPDKDKKAPDEDKKELLTLTVIGMPWEARRFPTPPAPRETESLIPVLPFPELPRYPILRVR